MPFGSLADVPGATEPFQADLKEHLKDPKALGEEIRSGTPPLPKPTETGIAEIKSRGGHAGPCASRASRVATS